MAGEDVQLPTPNYARPLVNWQDMAPEPESQPSPGYAEFMRQYMTHGAEKPPDYTQKFARGLTDWASSLPGKALDTAMTGPRLMGDVMEGRVDPNSPEAIGRSFEAASGLTGFGMMGAERNAAGMGIRAYHGSPHDFDKFDLSKIGTGEGAQAYGHGLYFAENPKVAESYSHPVEPGSPAAGIGLKGGSRYEVSINAHPDEFLDWDKPLSEQHPKVREAISKLAIGKTNDLFADIFEPHPSRAEGTVPDLMHRLGANKGEASSALRSAGIPGIKYLDQGSRGVRDPADAQKMLVSARADLAKSPDNQQLQIAVKQLEKQAAAPGPSHNYVVFDDKLIDVLKKYGIASVSALPALGAYHFQDSDVK